MLGGKSRISSLTGRHDYNPDFDRLINDAAHGRLKIDHYTEFDRPAYYGTSLSPSGENKYDGRRLSAKSDKRDD